MVQLEDRIVDRRDSLSRFSSLFIRHCLMPNNLVSRFRAWVRRFVFRTVSRSRLLSAIYYSVASTAFVREQQAVLYGKDQYYENLDRPSETQYLLRRNVHRLEKGLLMRPRRDVFATGYIEETTKTYCSALQQQDKGRPTDGVPLGDLKWAHDVLAEYFTVTASDPAIDRARDTFADAPNFDVSIEEVDGPTDLSRLIPYHREMNGKAPVSYDAFYALSRQRRSVRWFLDKPVPRETLDKAIRAAAQAPSACNRQPFQLRIFDDPDEATEIAKLAAGTKGYADNIPVTIVVVGRLRAYFAERDRHVIYIDGSLAAMSLMFALETLGLSSCPINWPDIEERERKMVDRLDLAPDERPIMLMAVGYPDPDGAVAASQKKSLATLRSYNRVSSHG